ncbi:MAG: putative polyphosphate/ATP-dependent NAD kinase [Paraglaciecola sp.]|jgi:predicted polyphosphate/ATP-dependent NAD kinase
MIFIRLNLCRSSNLPGLNPNPVDIPMSKIHKQKFKLGLLINPFAGIGGALALKGSDGAEIRNKALSMGAEKKANDRSRLALQELLHLKDDIQIYAAAGEMGESLAHELGFACTVVYRPKQSQTEGIDSEYAAQAMLSSQVDLLLFAGGDGTARNVCKVIASSIPVLGIPAGCKIHSGVYAITPQAAGRVAAMLVAGDIVSLKAAEVMDIDEVLFRQGRVNARQYGEMQVPSELQYVQAVKMAGRESDELALTDIAAHILEDMEQHPEYLYVMGSGSTVGFVMQELSLANSLLGVDLVLNKKLVAKDVTSSQLLDKITNMPTKLVITLIGGQGHIFGRGNQQLSPEFLRQIGQQNIIIIATKNKLQHLQGKPLITDTGEPELDAEFSGVIPVITGYHDQVLYPVARFD